MKLPQELRKLNRLKVRPSSLSGAWYAGTRKSLVSQIESLFEGPLGPGSLPKLAEKSNPQLLALMSPHAGYIYSGQAAAWAFWEASRYGPRDTVIIIGPNHRGFGSPVSASTFDRWSTPLGESEVDVELVKEIAKVSGFVDLDNSAHEFEHSIEIQLPFVQYVYGSAKIVPIVSYAGDFELSVALGRAISDVAKGKNVLIIASSDMTHYLTHEEVMRRDEETLSEIVSLDVRSLWSKATRLESLCGLDGVVAMVSAVKSLGGREAKVLCHYTSGDVTDDRSSVVGYASVAFYA